MECFKCGSEDKLTIYVEVCAAIPGKAYRNLPIPLPRKYIQGVLWDRMTMLCECGFYGRFTTHDFVTNLKKPEPPKEGE